VKHVSKAGLNVPPPTEMGVAPRRGMVDMFGDKDGERTGRRRLISLR